MRFFTLRVMCAWSENPSSVAISTSGLVVVQMAFQARRALTRALKLDGEMSKICINARDTVQGAIPFILLQGPKRTDGFRNNTVASSSGQSVTACMRGSARETSKAAAAGLLFSAIRTIWSGSLTLIGPRWNAQLVGSGRFRILAPDR